jgi:hypothetical protein
MSAVKSIAQFLPHDKPSPSARVVDGFLMITLPDAIKPVVWQYELLQSKASAMELRESDTDYSVVLKTPRGDAHEVARYTDKQDAIKALMVIGKALENSKGELRPLGADSIHLPAVIKQPSNLWKTFKNILAKLMVGVLIVLISGALLIAVLNLMSGSSGSQNTIEPVNQALPENQMPNVNSQTPAGQSIPADQFFAE